MTHVVLFGIGSPVVVDVEESLHRAGVRVAAGVRNVAGDDYVSQDARVITPDDLADDLRQLPFLVPLFRPAHRETAAREAARVGLRHPFRLVDATVAVPRRFTLGPGSYVNVGCSIGSCCDIGAFVFINRGASIGHHARLGDFVSIGPGAVLGGQVTVERASVIGIGAVILPSVVIGENATVGAGSVVSHDVPAGCLALGNPARIMRRGIGSDRSVA